MRHVHLPTDETKNAAVQFRLVEQHLAGDRFWDNGKGKWLFVNRSEYKGQISVKMEFLN